MNASLLYFILYTKHKERILDKMSMQSFQYYKSRSKEMEFQSILT